MITINKFFQILLKKEKSKTFYLLILVLIGVLFEMLSIGLLLPVLTSLTSENQNNLITFFNDLKFLSFLETSNKNTIIIFLISLLTFVYFVKTIFLTFLTWFQSKFINQLVVDLQIKLFKKYLNQDYIFHLERNSSKLIQNIVNEVELVVNVFFLSLITFTSEILVVIGISLVLLVVEPKGFLIIMIFFTTIGFFFMKYTKNKVKKWGHIRLENQSSSIKHLQQGIDGIKEIKITGNEKQFLQHFTFNVNKTAVIATKMLILQQIPKFYLEFVAIFCLTILISFLLISDYALSSVIVIVGLFGAAGFKILPSVNRIFGSFVNMRYGLASVDIVHKDLIIEPSRENIKISRSIKLNLEKKILIKNLSYSYPKTQEKILNNINLEIKANSMIGIVGESGSGKTTLIDIIIGILDPIEGNISVDSKDIGINKRLWQNNIGYIPQSIYLLDDTIKKNIALGVDENEIENEKILKSIKMSNLEKFVNSCPKKLNSVVGEFGARLSGGQRQRIGIARALYFDSDLLVLDEATSSLDENTEKNIINSINQMKGKKTILISAHKKKILKDCDVIFKVENGNIIQYKNLESLEKNEKIN